MDRHHRHGTIDLIAVGLARLRYRSCGMQTFPTQPIGGRRNIQSLTMHRFLHQPSHLLQIPQHSPPFGQISGPLSLKKLGQTTHHTQLG